MTMTAAPVGVDVGVPVRAIDVHQHLWPVPLLCELVRRCRPPRILETDDGWTLIAGGEPPWPVDAADHDPAARAALLPGDGIDLALVALSSPLGIESLPARQAIELVDAYHEGVRDMPRGLRAWASTALVAPDPVDLERRLDEGFVGLCLPAGAVSGPDGAARVAPLLEVLEARSAPLFVHPGPPSADSDPELPRWWPAMTSYVAQMHAAWLGFRTWVRPVFRRLRVCFAMLAGLAPLHAERLASRRGNAIDLSDAGVFYDTSSYGPRAIATIADAVGGGALVHGSDRPVIAPQPAGDPGAHGRRVLNPARLLGGEVIA